MFSLGRSVLPTLLVTFCFALNPVWSAGEDWPKYRHDLANSGRSNELTIDSSNVTSLQLKWELNIGGLISGSPAVATANGVSMVFVGNWDGVFVGVNAVTGQRIWSFTVDAVSPCSPGNCRVASSPAVSNGIVYFGAENAFLYALNAATGALVWKTQLADPTQGYEIWSSPAVFNNVVYVGVASHGDVPCVVGKVVARNASTGAPVWSFSTIDQTSCPSGQCVGAGVWASPALDTTNGILYVGTGNPGSTCSPSTANAARWPDSILAMNMNTGQLLNFFQAISNDNSDLDFGSSPVLYTNTYLNGCTGAHSATPFVAEASKDGSLYTVETGSGGLVVSTASGTHLDPNVFIASPGWRLTTYDVSCERYGDQVYHNGQLFLPAASGYFYRTAVPANLQGGASQASLAISPPNALYSAPAMIQDIALFGSSDHKLYAVNLNTMSIVWSYTTGGQVSSGPAISNGRVYVASYDGLLRCLSINGQ